MNRRCGDSTTTGRCEDALRRAAPARLESDRRLQRRGRHPRSPRREFDAVIMDVACPASTAWKRSRPSAGVPTLPLMLMTAYANPELLSQAQSEAC